MAAAATARARATLEQYAADRELQELIGWEAYRAGLDVRAAAADEAEQAEEAERHEEDEAAALPEPEQLDKDAYYRRSVEKRRWLLAAGIDTVFVRRRSSRDELVASRIHVRWRGMPAVDLPGKGRRDYAARPYLFDSPGDVGALLAEDHEPSRRN
jgi:hypothetical protein